MHIFSFLLGIYPGVRLVSHVVTLYLAFWGSTRLFFKVTVSFYIPTSVWGGSNFSKSLPTLMVGCHFDYSYPSGCAVVSPCSFDVHFPNGCWCWAYYCVFMGHSHVFFEEMFIQIFVRLLFRLFFYCWVVRVIYIFGILVLHLIRYVNTFTNFVGCLFIFLIE